MRIHRASMRSHSLLATAGFSQVAEMVSCRCEFKHDVIGLTESDGMQTAMFTSGISIRRMSMIRVGRLKALV